MCIDDRKNTCAAASPQLEVMPGRYGESTIVGNPANPRFCCIAANGPNRYLAPLCPVTCGVMFPSGKRQGTVMSLADVAGTLCDRSIMRGEDAMTARTRPMPGTVGYASILVIFVCLIGPALV